MAIVSEWIARVFAVGFIVLWVADMVYLLAPDQSSAMRQTSDADVSTVGVAALFSLVLACIAIGCCCGACMCGRNRPRRRRYLTTYTCANGTSGQAFYTIKSLPDFAAIVEVQLAVPDNGQPIIGPVFVSAPPRHGGAAAGSPVTITVPTGLRGACQAMMLPSGDVQISASTIEGEAMPLLMVPGAVFFLVSHEITDFLTPEDHLRAQLQRLRMDA